MYRTQLAAIGVPQGQGFFFQLNPQELEFLSDGSFSIASTERTNTVELLQHLLAKREWRKSNLQTPEIFTLEEVQDLIDSTMRKYFPLALVLIFCESPGQRMLWEDVMASLDQRSKPVMESWQLPRATEATGENREVDGVRGLLRGKMEPTGRKYGHSWSSEEGGFAISKTKNTQYYSKRAGIPSRWVGQTPEQDNS